MRFTKNTRYKTSYSLVLRFRFIFKISWFYKNFISLKNNVIDCWPLFLFLFLCLIHRQTIFFAFSSIYIDSLNIILHCISKQSWNLSFFHEWRIFLSLFLSILSQPLYQVLVLVCWNWTGLVWIFLSCLFFYFFFFQLGIKVEGRREKKEIEMSRKFYFVLFRQRQKDSDSTCSTLSLSHGSSFFILLLHEGKEGHIYIHTYIHC